MQAVGDGCKESRVWCLGNDKARWVRWGRSRVGSRQAAKPSPTPQLLAPLRAAEGPLQERQERRAFGEAEYGHICKEQRVPAPHTVVTGSSCPAHISRSSHLVCVCVCVCVCVRACESLSRVQLFASPRTVACQAPLSLGFSGQEYWSGLPFPPPDPHHG